MKSGQKKSRPSPSSFAAINLSRVVLFILLAVATCAFADDGETTPVMRLFRIGYIRPAGEADFTRAHMEAMRAALMADEAVTKLLHENGFRGIGLYETDGGSDMRVRLGAGEFDAAFTPSRIWLDQSAGYTVVLQTRRQRDITSARRRTVLQAGVLFLSPRSPFFDDEIIDHNEFAEYLSTQRIAVEYSQSLAGFIAPLSRLAEEYNLVLPTQDFLWCRSSAEVTKAVLSGLVDIGVCEEGGLDGTLEADGLLERKEELCRIVIRSRPVPSDPVVVRAEFAPAQSALGRELKRALRDFSLAEGFGGTSLQNAQDGDYIEVRLLLQQFEERFGAIRH